MCTRSAGSQHTDDPLRIFWNIIHIHLVILQASVTIMPPPNPIQLLVKNRITALFLTSRRPFGMVYLLQTIGTILLRQ